MLELVKLMVVIMDVALRMHQVQIHICYFGGFDGFEGGCGEVSGCGHGIELDTQIHQIQLWSVFTGPAKYASN